MGTHIADAVAGAAVGQIIGLPMGIKGEFQDLHAGEAGIGQQGLDLRGHIAQVLSNKAEIMEPGGQHPHQPHAGAGPPLALLGSLGAVGHGPIALQTTEMVNADHVIEFLGPIDAANPPAVAIGGHSVPVIQRVAPELAVLGKGIGRHAGDLGGHIFPVQLEILGRAPHVGRVHGHINRNVADELDPRLPGVGPQSLPLAEEQELHKDVKVHFLFQLPAVFLHRLRLVEADVLIGPLGPAGQVELALDGHKEGVILQPAGVLPAESNNLLCQSLPSVLPGLAQNLETALEDQAVIHPVLFHTPADAFQVRLFQQSLFHQHIQVDKIGVAGKGGEGGIGAVPIAGGAHGQKLPVFLPGGFQKVDKFIGGLAHGADAVGRGQGAHGHQDAAAASHHFHLLFSLLCDVLCGPVSP